MTAASEKFEPIVGKKLSAKSFTVDDRVLTDYFKGLGLPETARVPATIAGEPDNGYFAEIAFPNHVGHLWMRQEWAYFAPLERGKTYRVSGEIQDIYKKRDRTVVNYQVDLTDPNAGLAVRTHHHQSFLLDHDPNETVEFRDPSQKPGAKKFNLPEGTPFGGLARTITLEMCGDFFHGDANYHTDEAASRELGFRDVVVGGRMTMAYASEILEAHFADTWPTSGRLVVKFTNPTWAGDTVMARGIDTGPLPDDPARVGAFVWVEKADGTTVLVAEASSAR